MDNANADIPELEPVSLNTLLPMTVTASVVDEVKQRAIDFILRKSCSEKAKEAEKYKEWEKSRGYRSTFAYDADRDFQWLKEQQAAYDASKLSMFVDYGTNPAFSILSDAEALASLLLNPLVKVYHRSGRAAIKQKNQLKWFEESVEFKDLVPAALLRVVD